MVKEYMGEEGGLNKQGWSVWIGKVGGCPGMAALLGGCSWSKLDSRAVERWIVPQLESYIAI